MNIKPIWITPEERFRGRTVPMFPSFGHDFHVCMAGVSFEYFHGASDRELKAHGNLRKDVEQEVCVTLTRRVYSEINLELENIRRLREYLYMVNLTRGDAKRHIKTLDDIVNIIQGANLGTSSANRDK